MESWSPKTQYISQKKSDLHQAFSVWISFPGWGGDQVCGCVYTQWSVMCQILNRILRQVVPKMSSIRNLTDIEDGGDMST